MRDSAELMNLLRSELRRAAQQRFKRVELDRFKQEMRDFITHFLFDQTGHSPIVIPVVNIISNKVEARTVYANERLTTEDKAISEQKRFQEMRARLLTNDR
jgi:hypothetical protein